jgi:hypothetical protein
VRHPSGYSGHAHDDCNNDRSRPDHNIDRSAARTDDNLATATTHDGGTRKLLPAHGWR